MGTDNAVRVAQTATQQHMVHQFKNFVGSSVSCTPLCNLQSTLAASASTIYLQIYNQNTTTWDTIASNNTASANTDFDLTVNVPDLTNYKKANNTISCRVYQEAL